MESFLKDPSLSPSKQVKSKRKIQHQHQHQHQHQVAAARLPSIISRQASCSSAMNQKFAPPPPHVQMEMVQLAALAAGGVFFNHRHPQQFSHSSSLPPLLPTYYQHHPYHHQQQPQQPPLLPLPVVSKPITFRSLPPPSITRSQSLASAPIPKKQPNKAKATIKTATATATATSKKKPTQNPKKENKELVIEKTSEETKKKMNEDDDDEDQVVWPAKGAGPDPGTLPKEFMTRVLLAADLNQKESPNGETGKSTAAAAPVFNLISPPPSSLPLPKFTIMRQTKLSCNAEAAAAEVVDTGATDNLCRLLKLR